MFRWVDPLPADSYSHRSRPVPSTRLGASDLLRFLTALLQSNFSLQATRLHQAKRREAVLAVQLDVQFARPGVNSVLSYKLLSVELADLNDLGAKFPFLKKKKKRLIWTCKNWSLLSTPKDGELTFSLDCLPS